MGRETPKSPKQTILVVDDHESVLDGTVNVLKRSIQMQRFRSPKLVRLLKSTWNIDNLTC